METLKSLTKPLNGSAGEERSFRSFGSVPYCIGDGSLTKLTVFCCSLYSFSFLFDLCLGLCFKLGDESGCLDTSNRIEYVGPTLLAVCFPCNTRFQTVKFNYILAQWFRRFYFFFEYSDFLLCLQE